MPEMNEKLQNFSDAVIKVAEKEKQQKLSELEQEKDRLINEKETELLEYAYEDIQKNVVKSRRENSERVLKVEMNMKKDLILQREQIIDDVFGEVEKKLEEFTDSDKYGDWLIKRVSVAAEEVGKGKKEVYVTNKDLRFKDVLEKNIDNISVKCDDNDCDFIGGVKVINWDRNVSVNYAMKDMLDEKRAVFLQESGLSIY